MRIAQLVGHLAQGAVELRWRRPVQRNAVAQLTAGEIQQVIHHARGTLAGGAHVLGQLLGADFRRAAQRQVAGRLDRGQRGAQVVAEQGDELLTLIACDALVSQRRTRSLLLLFGIDLQGLQAGKRLEHRPRRRAGESRGSGSSAQSVPKKLPSARSTGTEI